MHVTELTEWWMHSISAAASRVIKKVAAVVNNSIDEDDNYVSLAEFNDADPAQGIAWRFHNMNGVRATLTAHTQTPKCTKSRRNHAKLHVASRWANECQPNTGDTGMKSAVSSASTAMAPTR